jgi:hypothetical protein
MDKHYSGLLWTSEHEDKIITEPVNNFDGRVFQQMVDIPMGTNCVPLLANLLYSCSFIRIMQTS